MPSFQINDALRFAYAWRQQTPEARFAVETIVAAGTPFNPAVSTPNHLSLGDALPLFTEIVAPSRHEGHSVRDTIHKALRGPHLTLLHHLREDSLLGDISRMSPFSQACFLKSTCRTLHYALGQVVLLGMDAESPQLKPFLDFVKSYYQWDHMGRNTTAWTKKAQDLIKELPGMLQTYRLLMNFLEARFPKTILPIIPSCKLGTSELISDAAGKPGAVVIDFPLHEQTNWQARLSALAAYRKHFPESLYVLSAEAFFAPQLYQQLMALGMTDKDNVVIIPRKHGSSDRPWPRDGISMTIDRETGAQRLSLNERLIQTDPLSESRMAQASGAEVIRVGRFDKSVRDFEGGNILPLVDRPVVLVGVLEICEVMGVSLLDREETLRAVEALQEAWGRQVVLIGDPYLGQTIHHLDLYIKPLENGVVTVTDFRRGCEALEAFTPEVWREMRQNHENEMVGYEGWAPFLEFLKGMEEDAAHFLPLLKKRAEYLEERLGREILQLKRAGLRVKRVLGFPIFGQAEAATYTNGNTHGKGDDSVMLLARLMPKLDALAENNFREAGFTGRFEWIEGLAEFLVVNGGATRCLTFITPQAGSIASGLTAATMSDIMGRAARFSEDSFPLFPSSGHQMMQFSRPDREFKCGAMTYHLQKAVKHIPFPPYFPEIVAYCDNLIQRCLPKAEQRLNSVDPTLYWQYLNQLALVIYIHQQQRRSPIHHAGPVIELINFAMQSGISQKSLL